MVNSSNSSSALPMSHIDHFNCGYTPINAGPGPTNPVLLTPVSVMQLPSMPSLSDSTEESTTPIKLSCYTQKQANPYIPTHYSMSRPSSPKSRPPVKRYPARTSVLEMFTLKRKHNPGCRSDVTPVYGKSIHMPQDITAKYTAPTYQATFNSTVEKDHVVADLQGKDRADDDNENDDWFVTQDPETRNVATGVFFVNVFPKRLSSEMDFPEVAPQDEEAAALKRLASMTEVSCFRIPQAINIPRKFKKSKNLQK